MTQPASGVFNTAGTIRCFEFFNPDDVFDHGTTTPVLTGDEVTVNAAVIADSSSPDQDHPGWDLLISGTPYFEMPETGLTGYTVATGPAATVFSSYSAPFGSVTNIEVGGISTIAGRSADVATTAGSLVGDVAMAVCTAPNGGLQSFAVGEVMVRTIADGGPGNGGSGAWVQSGFLPTYFPRSPGMGIVLGYKDPGNFIYVDLLEPAIVEGIFGRITGYVDGAAHYTIDVPFLGRAAGTGFYSPTPIDLRNVKGNCGATFLLGGIENIYWQIFVSCTVMLLDTTLWIGWKGPVDIGGKDVVHWYAIPLPIAVNSIGPLMGVTGGFCPAEPSFTPFPDHFGGFIDHKASFTASPWGGQQPWRVRLNQRDDGRGIVRCPRLGAKNGSSSQQTTQAARLGANNSYV